MARTEIKRMTQTIFEACDLIKLYCQFCPETSDLYWDTDNDLFICKECADRETVDEDNQYETLARERNTP